MNIKRARKVMRNAFEKDPDFAETYVANIATLLHDKYGITDPHKRHSAGTDILELIFWD